VALLEEVSTGCRSDELRELIGVINISAGTENPALLAARSAFEHFRGSGFADELRECRSLEQFDAILEDLDLFHAELDVDVRSLAQRVEEAKAEFEEHAGEYADHMQDEWKERWRDERDSERGVSEMFGSLRGDRD
jgi:hypothetical protein